MEDYIRILGDAVEIGFNETIVGQAPNIVKYCEKIINHGHQ